MSLIYYIKDLKNVMYIYYLKYFLLFTILVPIFMNVIALYFLDKTEKTGKISILQSTKNKNQKKKILPSLLNRYINNINNIAKNKELLNYYKGRCKAELVFYVVIIILYVFLFV